MVRDLRGGVWKVEHRGNLGGVQAVRHRSQRGGPVVADCQRGVYKNRVVLAPKVLPDKNTSSGNSSRVQHSKRTRQR